MGKGQKERAVKQVAFSVSSNTFRAKGLLIVLCVPQKRIKKLLAEVDLAKIKGESQETETETET